jgi:hypothetical protein
MRNRGLTGFNFMQCFSPAFSPKNGKTQVIWVLDNPVLFVRLWISWIVDVCSICRLSR